jgi:hypothetical protein
LDQLNCCPEASNILAVQDNFTAVGDKNPTEIHLPEYKYRKMPARISDPDPGSRRCEAKG